MLKYSLPQNIMRSIYYIYNATIAITFTGLFNINLEYINIFHSIITYITCSYIIYNFNPFIKLKTINSLDKDIIFMCGYLLLFTTTISNIFFNEVKNVGFFGKKLHIMHKAKQNKN